MKDITGLLDNRDIVECRILPLFKVKRFLFIFKKTYKLSVQICLHKDGHISVIDYFNPKGIKNFDKIFRKEIEEVIIDIRNTQTKSQMRKIQKNSKPNITYEDYIRQVRFNNIKNNNINGEITTKVYKNIKPDFDDL